MRETWKYCRTVSVKRWTSCFTTESPPKIGICGEVHPVTQFLATDNNIPFLPFSLRSFPPHILLNMQDKPLAWTMKAYFSCFKAKYWTRQSLEILWQAHFQWLYYCSQLPATLVIHCSLSDGMAKVQLIKIQVLSNFYSEVAQKGKYSWKVNGPCLWLVSFPCQGSHFLMWRCCFFFLQCRF